MPEIDFDTVDDVGSFSPLPEATYPCELEKVDDSRTTKAGDEMWGLKWVVLTGEYEGRYIFDNLVFSKAGYGRVKLLCSKVGLPSEGKVNLTPEMLQGRSALVTVEINEYMDDSGKTKINNKVTFDGYEEYEKGAPVTVRDEEVPF